MRPRLMHGVLVCLLIAGTLSQAAAQADTYPNKPVRIITHSAAGGAPDAGRVSVLVRRPPRIPPPPATTPHLSVGTATGTAGAKVTVPARPADQLAQDQQCPPLTEDIEPACDRTVLVVVPERHHASLAELDMFFN